MSAVIPSVSYELGIEGPGLAMYFSMHMCRPVGYGYVDPESQMLNQSTLEYYTEWIALNLTRHPSH